MSTVTQDTANPPANLPPEITRKQLAGFLRVSEQTADRRVREWRLPRYPVPGRLRAVCFRSADVLAAPANGKAAA